MQHSGADLALLMLGGFRVLADRGRAELALRGYEDVRPMHVFALHAVLDGADTASELGRRMSVTKQAAADAIGLLQSRHYLAREADPTDRRRVRLHVTAHGRAMLDEGDRVFDALRQDLEAKVGSPRVAQLEATLRQLVGDDVVRPGSPGTATDGISS